MRYRTAYRICLLAVVIFTIAGGIFYYTSYMKREAPAVEGTLVREEGRAADERQEFGAEAPAAEGTLVRKEGRAADECHDLGAEAPAVEGTLVREEGRIVPFGGVRWQETPYI